MKSPSHKDIAVKLVPDLSEKEKQEMVAYFTAYEKYTEELAAEALEDLKDHPIFGKLIRDTPKEVTDAQSKISRELQKGAIMDSNWLPYIEYQIEQGIIYAKMGFDFKSWYEIVALAKRYIRPYLHKEYGIGPELFASLNGMDRFIDIGMSIIGEAYVQEKQDIISEDQEKIRQMNEMLELKVTERTTELETINHELEAFTYSVSHDLRAPLRAVSGYAEMLNEDYGTQLDDEGRRIIEAIRYYGVNMGTLIDDLLDFSRLGRKEMRKEKIDMNELMEGVLIDMNKSISHKAEIKIGKLKSIKADYGLLHQTMFNLVSNAVKYSSTKEKPLVEISAKEQNNEIIFSVKDNGVGFDMKYSDKLFGVFQRLHSQQEFEGTGVGLAIVHRIIARHNGKVWAEGKVNEGAIFSFSLPIN